MKINFIVCLLLISQIGFGQQATNYEAKFDSILKTGNSDALITYFENELIAHPKDETILRWLGFSHLMLNNPDKAELYYLQAIEVNPACARCYQNIGRAYTYKGDTKQASIYFNKAIAIDPKDAFIWADRGRLMEMMGDEFGALRDYDKAIQLDPQNPDLYNMRGEYNVRFGYTSLALNDFSKAIQINPKFDFAYFNRASAYYTLNRLDEALADLNLAIEINRSHFEYYSGRGAILDAMGNRQQALDDYNTAIAMNPNEPSTYLNRARLLYQMEDLDAACTDYVKLKQDVDKGVINDQPTIDEINSALPDFCDSTKASYYYQRGVAFYNLERYQQAIDIYTIGLSHFPNNAIALSFKGNALMAVSQYQLALENYYLSLENKANIREEVLANPRFKSVSQQEIDDFYNGSLATTYSSIAECWINLGQLDKALQEIQTAIEIAPKIDEIGIQTFYNMRGYVYLLKGNYNLAIADFNMAITIDPKFPLPYVNRAVAQISLAEQVKIKSYSFSSELNAQPIQLSWEKPSKSSIKNSEIKILAALADCNTAIELDPQLGYGYYVRGQIKLMLNYADNCTDLHMAKNLGLIVENELLKGCD